jgi:quercetin dioxygenase-like cupin family protein
MKDIEQYINSGILELYVLGMTTDEEAKEITLLAQSNSAIKTEIDAITTALEIDAVDNAPQLSSTIKPLIMATIDYTERLTNGETPTFPPLLNEKSTINDYAEWLNRNDMVLPIDADPIHAKIIGFTPEATTILTWLKDGAPLETHTNEYERFLIIEGTCDIIIGETLHSLVPGNYLAIPLHIGHLVKTTSSIPCKIIVQRVAA